MKKMVLSSLPCFCIIFSTDGFVHLLFLGLCVLVIVFAHFGMSVLLFVCVQVAISRSSQCSTTGVTKAVVCVILSVGWCI